MALLNSQIQRIRAELGYNAIGIGAEPFINVVSIFDNVIKTYLSAGATTMATTQLAAVDTAVPVALQLVDATGFATGARVFVDVDERQEDVVVQNVVLNVITVQLRGAHSDAYPVTVDGGEAIVLECLRHLQTIRVQLGELPATSGVKKVDSIEFFGGVPGVKTPREEMTRLRNYWRDELASILGVENLNGRSRRGNGTISLY